MSELCGGVVFFVDPGMCVVEGDRVEFLGGRFGEDSECSVVVWVVFCDEACVRVVLVVCVYEFLFGIGFFILYSILGFVFVKLEVEFVFIGLLFGVGGTVVDYAIGWECDFWEVVGRGEK